MIRLALAVVLLPQLAAAQKPFTLEQILSAPFAANLTAAKKVNRIAWTLDEEGKRNVWVAEGSGIPGAAADLVSDRRRPGNLATQFLRGRQLARLCARWGEKSGRAIPESNQQSGRGHADCLGRRLRGGEPRKVEPDIPRKSLRSGTIAYVRDGQIWLAALDGSDKPTQLVVRGQNHYEQWSPDGARLAFVSSRGDHSFIGVYDVASKEVSYLAPSVDTDSDPTWSLDGKRIAFVRRPAEPRDTPQGYFIEPDRPHPWSIWVADVATTTAHEIWHSSTSPQGSFPYMADDTGGGVLNWAADNQLVIASEEDGWQHLYELTEPTLAQSTFSLPATAKSSSGRCPPTALWSSSIPIAAT